MTERRVNQQSAVDTWYLRFLKNLETEYHAELAWNLIMMGRAEASISIDVYKPFLNRYKDEILKAMLTAIANKDTELNYSDRELNELLVGARKLGVNWPELDIMERSVKADQMIEEARYSRINLPKTDRGWVSAVSKDPSLIHYNPSPSEAVQLAAVKTQGRAIRYIKSPTEAVQLAAVQNDGWAIEFINKHYTNIRAPSEAVQLAAVIRDGSAIYNIKKISQSLLNNPEVKHSVVSIMLKWIREWLNTNDTEPLEWCEDQVEQLRNANCTWPELDIIERSLRNMPTQSNPDEDIVESSDWDAIKRSLEADNRIGEGRFDAEERRQARDFLEGIPAIADSPEDCMYPFSFGYDHEDLFDRGLKPFFQPHREIWIRFLLENIRDGSHFDLDDIANAVNLLRNRIGLDWPELEVIERSLKADTRLNEGGSDAGDKAALRDEGRKLIIDMMRMKAENGGRGIFYVMYHMDEWGFKLSDWPEIREMIDTYKHYIIVDILKGIKLHGNDGMESARFTIDRMRRIGVDWSELAVIERSLNA